MVYPRLAVIAVDTTNNLDVLRPVHKMDFMLDTEIHLVHVVRKMDYDDGLSFNATFPLYQDTDAIKEAVMAKLKSIAPEILPYQHIGKIKFQCLFGFDPKHDFCQYLEEVKSDLVMVASRPKHGLFESSFAYYVGRHAPCNVLVIKS